MGNQGTSINYVKDLGYSYPLRNDFSPSGTLHRNVLARLQDYARISHQAMQPKYAVMDLQDQQLTSFIVLDKKERKIKNEDTRKPLGIVVPMAVTILDTLLAHTMNSYAGQMLFRYTSNRPSDKVAAMLYQLDIHRQMQRNKGLLALHTQARDGFAYGMGVVTPTWKVHKGTKVESYSKPVISQVTGQNLGNDSGTRLVNNAVLFEGSALDNIDLRLYRPDPNVPVDKVQEGEFVGWYVKSSYNKMLAAEAEEPDVYFNVRYLNKNTSNLSNYLDKRTTSVNAIGARDNENSGVTGELDIMHMYVRLVPKEWKVGKGELPELWLFSVVGDELIVRAAPANLYHNMFPVGVFAPMYDGYSVWPVSKLECMYELGIAANYAYSSMLHEMRKSMHNRFVIDPGLVRYDHATSNDPSQMICMREQSWGRGVQNAIEQLQVTNVTKDNMQHIGMFQDFAYKASGAVDSLQGNIQKSGERRSATEFRDTRLSAIGRVEKDIMINSLMNMQDLAYIVYKHTQQFKSQDSWVDFSGEHALELKMLFDGPGTLFDMSKVNVELDVQASDSTTYGGEFLNEQIQLFQLAQANPETFKMFDFTRWMLDLERRSGMQDPSSLLKPNIKVMMMPTAEAMAFAGALGSDNIAPTPKPSQVGGMGGADNGTI
jgi:hypothetical protein